VVALQNDWVFFSAVNAAILGLVLDDEQDVLIGELVQCPNIHNLGSLLVPFFPTSSVLLVARLTIRLDFVYGPLVWVESFPGKSFIAFTASLHAAFSVDGEQMASRVLAYEEFDHTTEGVSYGHQGHRANQWLSAFGA